MNPRSYRPYIFIKLLLFLYSSSTIPIALSDLETKHKVDRRICQFIIPVGTTINKGGSGMYNAVSAIYIAQTQHGFTMDIGSAIILW
jgi:Na+/H+-dicarboxylate symporter